MGEAWPERRHTHGRRDATTESFETEPFTAGQFPRSVCSRIIEADQLATITTDRHGVVVRWDGICEQMFGWSQVQAAGTELGELLSVYLVEDEDAEESQRGIIARVSKAGSWSGPVVSRCIDASPVPVLVAASCLTSPKGKVAGYVVMCTPTSEDLPSQFSQPPQSLNEDHATGSTGEMFFKVFLDSPVGTALVGVDGYIVDVNHALCRSLGLARDELVGENFIKFTHPEDRDLEFDYAQRLFDGKIDRFQIDRRFTRGDGSTMTGRITASTVRDPAGLVLFGIGVVEDVTERLRAEKAHLESETVFRRTIEASNDAFVGIDSSGRVTDWNAAAESLFGWASNEAIGRPLLGMVVSEGHSGAYSKSFTTTLAAGMSNRALGTPVEAFLMDRAGREFPVEISLAVVEQDGQMCAKAFIRDVSQRHALEEQLTRQALTDSLTGLPNRALLRDRLATAVARLDRNPGLAAVMMLDMDRFKIVNDSLGHVAGDEMLKIVAERIRSVVRVGDTVGRVGGDEFVVVAEDFDDTSEVVFLADRIIEAVSEPLELQGLELHPGASVGIAVATDSSSTADKLLRDADLSMYRAKERGGGTAELFDDELYARALARLELEAELRRAIDEEQLRVYYQPVVSFDGKVSGFEALVRWQHPERGIVPPIDFIPLAEETGLVVPLGAWVLEKAAEQVAAWQEMIDPELSLSVNLSSRQLADPELPAVVARILTETGLPPGKLCLELTETALIEDPQSAERCLTELRALGVRIGVDDFGTGYSSLIYVRRFPVQVLKLDRLFVAGLGESAEDETIAGSVIHLAHELGLEAVAEGVETLDQLHTLDSLGCDLAQGFYWSKPRPADEIERVLLDGHNLGPRDVPDSRIQRDTTQQIDVGAPDGCELEEVIPAVRAAS